RETGALRLQRVLDDLHDDLLAGLEEVGDLRPALLAAAAPRRLDARQHDLVDVQEAVLVEADVDERGLQAGQDVVDLALVDVADDGPRAAALEIQLGDARHAPAHGFQQRNTSLPTVHADQHLLLHE